jgi:hypothetical protein
VLTYGFFDQNGGVFDVILLSGSKYGRCYVCHDSEIYHSSKNAAENSDLRQKKLPRSESNVTKSVQKTKISHLSND